MSKYSISEKAIEDINKIWIYTAENWSIEQADRYYNLILDEIEFIAQNFQMAIDFESIRKSYRYSKVKSHLVFFKKTSLTKLRLLEFFMKFGVRRF